MYFNKIEVILGICFGFFGINHADDRATVPVILERTCYNVTYAFDVLRDTETQGNFYLYETNTSDFYFGFTRLIPNYGFVIRAFKEGKFYEHFKIGANKRPADNDDNYTVFIAFQYPDERNEYRLSLKDFGPPGTELTSSLKVGKSRCIHEDGVIGCDPYCVCDTVVQKTCFDYSIINGKCLDTGSTTENSARFVYDEECPITPTVTTDTAAVKSTIIQAAVAGAVMCFIVLVGVILFIKKKRAAESSKPSEGNDYHDVEE